MNTLGIVGWDRPAVVVQQDATVAKEAALESSRIIKTITNDLEAELASETLREMKGLLNACEKGRKEIKAPVIELGRQIDSTAYAYANDLEAEVYRVARLVGNYHEDQRQKAVREQLARQAELDRIEKEKREAEEKLRREADAALVSAPTIEAAVKVAQETEKAVVAIDHAATAQFQSALAVPVAAPPKLAGVSVRPLWKFEVVDLQALHTARPDLVELRPRTALINSAIAGGTQIPGLRIWQENATRIRA
ncbi:MAG: hypothetical protein E6Q97_00105 [Desulfurellales bacterium]|nr:MAG: hypothetical protein E6Q97_00105 [Desulfurellales bacterium]